MNKFRLFKKMPVALLAIIMIVATVSPAFASEVKSGPGYMSYFQGEELKMLANQTESQMMSFVITTKNGAVIVIDGGTPGDAAHLRQVLAEKGNHVNAWFITHPHSDHAGALAQIVEEGLNGLTVDAVVCNFADPAWYQANEGYRADFVERIRAGLAAAFGDRTLIMHRGSVYDIDGVHITCMNDPYLVNFNSINNSSCVLKFEMGGKKIIFLGDMDESVGNQFLADHAGEDLKCDIVQMAHHGQAGVGRNFYEALSPTTCLWCAPGWLYDDPVDKYRTKEVRGWMKELGANDHHSIKNGDRTLK